MLVLLSHKQGQRLPNKAPPSHGSLPKARSRLATPQAGHGGFQADARCPRDAFSPLEGGLNLVTHFPKIVSCHHVRA